MASFFSDTFSDASLGSQWATSGPGSVSVSGGHLRITVDETTYTYVLQESITDIEFDLIARIKCPFYPSKISSAYYQCGFVVLSGDDYVGGWQNYVDDVGKNEAYLATYIDPGPVYATNPVIDPMQYIVIRLQRDVAGDLYIYYNTEADGSGEWVEQSPASRLNTSGAVDIGIRARSAPSTEITYEVDYIQGFASDYFVDYDDAWVNTDDDYWQHGVIVRARAALFQSIGQKEVLFVQVPPPGDFFVDYHDTWVDTTDDFWFPTYTIPINAKAGIFQSIGKKVRLQPIDIRAIGALIQSIAQSGVSLDTVTTFYIYAVNAILSTIGQKRLLDFGSVCWGHDTCEEYWANLSTWTGTGLIPGGGSVKRIQIDQGQYMDSPVWHLGSGTGRLNLEKYTRKSVKLPNRLRYKTGATIAACNTAEWTNISDNGSFVCSGFVRLRVGSTTATAVSDGAFYDNAGFNWQDDGGFNWE